MSGAVALIILWVGIATYADILFKSSKTLASCSFVAACLLYASTGFLAFWTFRQQRWGWIVILWNSLSLSLSLFLSVVVFSERLTLRRLLAALLVLAASVLAE